MEKWKERVQHDMQKKKKKGQQQGSVSCNLTREKSAWDHDLNKKNKSACTEPNAWWSSGSNPIFSYMYVYKYR